MKFQGAEFQFVGIDEATQISESNFLYLFSRLRKTTDNPVPLRFRAASNPSSDALWLYHRYIADSKPDKSKIFIPSGIDDNPHLNQEEYKATLANLDAKTREELLNGLWTVKAEGGMFKPESWGYIEALPPAGKFVRAWDLASSDPTKNKRADYTVGTKIGRWKDFYYIVDVVRFRGTPAEVDNVMLTTALKDGTRVPVLLPIDPGAAGQIAYEHYVSLLRGFMVKGKKNTGSKVDRAGPYSSAVENRRVFLLRAPWNKEFVDEHSLFPSTSNSIKDDQVDSAAWGFNGLQKYNGVGALPISLGAGVSYWEGGY